MTECGQLREQEKEAVKDQQSPAPRKRSHRYVRTSPGRGDASDPDASNQPGTTTPYTRFLLWRDTRKTIEESPRFSYEAVRLRFFFLQKERKKKRSGEVHGDRKICLLSFSARGWGRKFMRERFHRICFLSFTFFAVQASHSDYRFSLPTSAAPQASNWSERVQKSLGEGMACELLIVRHGERDDEVPGSTWYKTQPKRWFDPPLTERGLKHALVVADELYKHLSAGEKDYDFGFDFIACSPLLRAAQTAQAFSKVFNLPIKVYYHFSQWFSTFFHCIASSVSLGCTYYTCLQQGFAPAFQRDSFSCLRTEKARGVIRTSRHLSTDFFCQNAAKKMLQACSGSA